MDAQSEEGSQGVIECLESATGTFLLSSSSSREDTSHRRPVLQNLSDRLGEPERGTHRGFPRAATARPRHPEIDKSRGSGCTASCEDESARKSQYSAILILRSYCNSNPDFTCTEICLTIDDRCIQVNLCHSDRKSTRLNSSHSGESRMPSSA